MMQKDWLNLSIFALCVAALTSSCKTESASESNLAANDQAASLQECQALTNMSCEAFRQAGGYSAFNSCQNAAQNMVAICNDMGFDARRFSLYCERGAHAIVMLRVKDASGSEWWCPQEPQNPASGQLSNVDSNLCLKPGQPEPPDYNSRVCIRFGLGQGVRLEWMPAGENPEPTNSDPYKTCAGNGQYPTASHCRSCCDRAWGSTNPMGRVARGDEWVNQCYQHCSALPETLQQQQQVQQSIPNQVTESDSDGDGIPDQTDRCSKTPIGAAVHTSGYFVGCAQGQTVDSGY